MLATPISSSFTPAHSPGALASAVLAACLALTVAGCSDDSSGPSGTGLLFDAAVAVRETGDAEIPVVAAARDGSRIGALRGTVPGGLRGVIITLRDNRSATVIADDAGRPSRLVLNDLVILFANWTGSTVDLAAVRASGETHVRRRVAIENLSRTAFSSEPGDGTVLASIDGVPVSTFLNLASNLIGLALCTAAELSSIQALSQSTAVVVAACSSLLLSVLSDVTEDDEEALLESSDAVDEIGDDIGCGDRSALDCWLFLLGAAADVLDDAEATQEEMEDEIDLADAALNAGGGDVQITLTWNNTADLDLYVVDPAGATISFSNPSSPSGGQLDVDDTDGFGPENIFWPSGGAPSGTYRVEVDHFAGPSPASFRVLVQAFGQVKAYTGTVAANQTVTVVTFSSGQPLPSVVASVVAARPRDGPNKRVRQPTAPPR